MTIPDQQAAVLDLEACPFCGGEPFEKRWGETESQDGEIEEGFYEIACRACNNIENKPLCLVHASSRRAAITAWNTRAPKARAEGHSPSPPGAGGIGLTAAQRFDPTVMVSGCATGIGGDHPLPAHSAGSVPEGWRPTHRHVKRGTTYRVIGPATLQAGVPPWDGEPMVVYKDERGIGWVRPEAEFNDGRFEALAAAPTPPVQPALDAKELTPGIDPQPSWGGRKSKEFGEVLEEGRGAALPSWMRGGGQ